MGQKENIAWKKELADSFKDPRSLSEFLGYNLPKTCPQKVFVPKKLAMAIKGKGPQSALWRQFIPDDQEILLDGLIDPIGDQVHQVTPHLIHRYPHKVLFLPTTACPINCRYCFRKNELVDDTFHGPFDQTWNYLKNNTEIEEVIFSGGDPLILPDEILEKYLGQLALLSHVKYIRFHTRVPSILPSRITPEFINLLERYREYFDQICINIHINHSEELRPEVHATLKNLTRSSIYISSQTVLLKGVNDNISDLKDLYKELYKLKFSSGYLHHPDKVAGAMHFWVSPQRGETIYLNLRRVLPGPIIPQYVIDLPGGHGKIPVKFQEKDKETIFTDHAGLQHKYSI